MDWWQIVLICVGAVFVWVLLSALLYRAFFKRFYDIVLSGLALLVLSPILLILTILGAIKMKGNPFFTQPRPGKDGKVFKLIKFRSMTNAKGADGKLLPPSKRLTKYGKILRSTSLDELPELINIFIGNMSLIGPRPLLVEYLPYYSEEESRRHEVRPGLTGLAQANGRNAISWEQKFAYDVYYVDNVTLWHDIKIIFQTVLKVVKRSNIQFDPSVKEGSFLETRKRLAEQREQEKNENN